MSGSTRQVIQIKIVYTFFCWNRSFYPLDNFQRTLHTLVFYDKWVKNDIALLDAVVDKNVDPSV